MADSNNISGMGGMSGQQADAQMQAQLKQAKEGSINTVKSLVNVKEDADGKAHFLGFEVPKEFASTLRLVANVLPNYVEEFLRGGVYDHTSSAVTKLNRQFNFSTDTKIGHRAGLASTVGISALLIGLMPISDVVHGVRERGKERKKITEALAVIEETNKDSYNNNEVIKTAFELTNNTLTLGFKRAASQLPTVLLNGFWSAGSHKEFAKQKLKALEKKQFEAVASEKVGSSDDIESIVKKGEETEKKFEEIFSKYNITDPDKRARFKTEHLEKQKLEQEHELKAKYQTSSGNTETKAVAQPDGAVKVVALTAASGLSEFLGQWAVKGSKDKKPCAYELIMKLQDNVINGGSGSDISGDIVEIFKQNEIDRGRSGIGSALLEKMQPLAERIGEVIAKGELDPLSLVNLVGEGKVINKRRFVSEESLEKIIDEQRAIFGSHEKTPLDEFLADFQKPTMIMQAIKENLKTLEGNDKAVFASMFSDDVLISAGIVKKDILALRTQGHDYMYEFMKSSTLELAKQTPEELKAHGLSEKQIESINSLNELLIAGNEKEVRSTIERGGGAVNAIRNARLAEQLQKGGDGKKYWTEKIHQKIQAPIEKPVDMSAVEKVSAGRDGGGVPLGGAI